MIGLIKLFLNSTALTANAKPLNTMINEVKSTNLINYGSAVKSIQSGVQAGSDGNIIITINISTVTPSKCLVFFDGFIGNNNGITVLPHKQSLTSSVLTVASSSVYVNGSQNKAANFSWQIIEFY